MLQYDFEDSVGYWIFSTAQALSHTLNEQLTEHGITYRVCVGGGGDIDRVADLLPGATIGANFSRHSSRQLHGC